MIVDQYEGIIEKRVRRSSYVEEVLARMEKGTFSLIAKEHIGFKFIPELEKEDCSTSDEAELILGERSRRLRDVREYQPGDIDQSHMQDVLDREPQFPGGM